MRYADGGGLTDAERAQREAVRMSAADDFDQGATYQQVAGKYRVAQKSAWQWWNTWKTKGRTGLLSKGPASQCRLTGEQLRELASMLDDGPAPHGWPADQRWTLARVCELVTRTFGVGYTLKGMSVLLHRIGYTPQVPARRAVERSADAVETWVRQEWPRGKRLRANEMRGSSSKTNPGRVSARPPSAPGHAADTPR